MTMRTWLALGAGGLMASPALAADLTYTAAPPPIESPVYSNQSMITGDVALAFGYIDYFDDGAEFVGSGRLNIPFGYGFNVELELAGLAELFDDGYTAFGGFSHAYWKTEQYAAGFVVGASSLDGDGAVSAGVEGAVFMPTTTWVGQLVYTWGDGSVPDFWLGSGEVRWYVDPNTKLAGTITYADWDSSWMVSGLAEHRYDNTQFSLFASASYFSSGGDDGWEVLLGGRLFFDQPGQTLQGHDHDVPFSVGRAVSF